jgi:hypothetical protein
VSDQYPITEDEQRDMLDYLVALRAIRDSTGYGQITIEVTASDINLLRTTIDRKPKRERRVQTGKIAL